MNSLRLQTDERQVSLARRLFFLERGGRYQDALDEVADIWPDREKLPALESFDPENAAEILLRCGSLIGFHGHNVQQTGAQERSRDLLMKAQARFLTLKNEEKAAECDNYLALSYWRTGEQNEAQIWIDESFARKLSDANPVRLFTHIIQCLVNTNDKVDAENLERLKALEPEFLNCGDDCLIGDYFTHCGLAFGALGKNGEALEHFEFSRYHFQRSRHRIYLGIVENNLTALYRAAGLFDKAHTAIDNATRLFRLSKDKTREGFSLDTKATLLIAEQHYAEALKTVEKALSLLARSENSDYFIETLMTKAKVLLLMDNFPNAFETLIDAVNRARVRSGEDSARRLIAEFEEVFKSKNAGAESLPSMVEEDSLELLLPQSLAHYPDYRGVWINNGRLATIGLVKGSLAVVAKADVQRGDLAAAVEIETGEVSCGFYDADFGIVCLEGADGDLQVFNEVEIRVLGKIVGVCRDGKRIDGKFAVDTIGL